MLEAISLTPSPHPIFADDDIALVVIGGELVARRVWGVARVPPRPEVFVTDDDSETGRVLRVRALGKLRPG